MNDVEIIDYAPEYHARFKEINVAWIEKSYEMEPLDWKQLDNPQNAILKDGGCIILAKFQDQIVGTCALVKIKDGVYELIKMAVDENFRARRLDGNWVMPLSKKAKHYMQKKLNCCPTPRDQPPPSTCIVNWDSLRSHWIHLNSSARTSKWKWFYK